MSERLDEIDVKILNLLQAKGRMQRNRIAEEVGLTVPSVSERMRKLEERGVIKGYYAVLDAKRLHLDITVFIRVMVDGSGNYPAFVRHATECDEILEVHSITGEGSHMLKVRTMNTSTLERLLSRIQSWPGVQGTMSSIVLSSYKESSILPVQPTELYTLGHNNNKVPAEKN